MDRIRNFIRRPAHEAQHNLDDQQPDDIQNQIPAQRQWTTFNVLSTLAQPIRHFAFATSVYGNAEFFVGSYRNNPTLISHAINTLITSATLYSADAITRFLLNHYQRTHQSDPEFLHSRLENLSIDEECLYDATNIVTLNSESNLRPEMTEGEALIISDYLHDLFTESVSDIPTQLKRAIYQSHNNPVTLVQNCLSILRSNNPVIPRSGRFL